MSTIKQGHVPGHAQTIEFVFNDLRFAPLPKCVDPMPSLEPEVHGWYQFEGRPIKGLVKGVRLYKPNGVIDAYLVANINQGFFVVTAHVFEGQTRYMHSTCSTTEKWLGIEHMGMGAQREAICKAVNAFTASNGSERATQPQEALS